MSFIKYICHTEKSGNNEMWLNFQKNHHIMVGLQNDFDLIIYFPTGII